MLDGMNLDVSFCQGCGTFHQPDILDSGFDRWLVREVNPFEFDPVIDWGRLQSYAHLFASVKRSPF